MSGGLSEESCCRIAEGLKVLLANTYSIYLNTQNAHWNYEGKEFYSLHLLFEKQYQELAEAIDEIAERIRALGFQVPASFSFFKEKSIVCKECKEVFSVKMVEHLLSAHELLVCHARGLSEVAEQEKDGATVDLLGRRLGVHEKNSWMLRNYL